jgi:aryl-alcohol dehydrogenase-like predicted oxidoreductase
MQRALGTTGISVNAIGYGEWPLSDVNRPSDAVGIDVIRQAVEAGADLIDTADAYCLSDDEFGHGERLIRKALQEIGSSATVTVATKGGYARPDGDWVPAGRPERITECCKASLDRLGVDAIDLYQLHVPDPEVPVEDSVGAMADLQKAGLVRCIGVSNFDHELLARAQTVAVIESVQNECNVLKQDDIASGLIGHCAEQNITYIPWCPLGGEDGQREIANHPVLQELSEKYGVSAYRLQLRWLLSLGDNVLPIPGAKRATSILDSLAAASLEIEVEDLAKIGAIGTA